MSTMLDRGNAIAAAVEVEKYSKQGTELLQSGHLTSAVRSFKYAYKFAGDLDDESMERACAFNLGAAYIAMGQGEKGLQVLQQAIPPEEKRDGRSNGDLFFNFGLGYEVTKNVQEAIRYFNRSLEEYRLERDNLAMEIETLNKLAALYTMTQNHHLMNIYHQLAEAYAMQGNSEKQMWALCEKANAYNSYGDRQKAESAADECLKLSDKCDPSGDSGSIFNDLGLLYTQLQKYDRALKCFEEALPLAQSSDDKKKEAVIRQNLGAAYNFVGEYQRAISFHKSAADMYARLQNRNSQGQCYANLAYAYSQLGDMLKAKQAFDHALLAAEDTDDNRTQWQVSEGLGSVAFNEEDFDEAIEFFKKALGVLAARESNITAQNRIVEKLKQALEAQIKEKETPYSRIGKEVVNPLKSGNRKIVAEQPIRPSSAKPVSAETPAVSTQPERRHIRVSKSGSAKRFSKVARGLSDLMEPFVPSPTPRSEGDQSISGLQGETLRPVQSESEEESSESETESESDDNRFESNEPDPTKLQPGPRGTEDTPSNRSLRGSAESTEESETEESSDDEEQEKKAVRDQMRKIGRGERGEDSAGELGHSDYEEDKDRGNEKRQQNVKAEVHGRNEESSSETESETESGSSETDSGEEPPPVPSGSLPKTEEMKTYEKPLDRAGSKKKMNYADINFDLSPTRGEKPPSKKHPNYIGTPPEEEPDNLRVDMGTRASGTYAQDDIDDPLYQTVPSRTLHDDDIKGPNFADFSSLPRGEKDRIMYEKHKQDQKNREAAPPLPERPVKEAKTCSVM